MTQLVDPNAIGDGFPADDFAEVAMILRKLANVDRQQFHAVMSNNFNVILAALDRAARPAASPSTSEGYKLVPVEPTEAMIEAGIDALREHTEVLAIARDPLFVWRAMLASAPSSKENTDG